MAIMDITTIVLNGPNGRSETVDASPGAAPEVAAAIRQALQETPWATHWEIEKDGRLVTPPDDEPCFDDLRRCWGEP